MRTITLTCDLQEALENEFFAGYFVSDRTWYLEKYPLGVFAGEPYGYRYKNVRFFPAIPRIPGYLLGEIITYFRQNLDREYVVQVVYRAGKFFVHYPEMQQSSKYMVSYVFQIPIGTLLVMTIHSHNTMPAYFSATDNEDEKITGLYGVIGRLDRKPQIRCRASLSGSFGDIAVNKLFNEKGGDRVLIHG